MRIECLVSSFFSGLFVCGLACAQETPLATVHLIGTQHAPGQLLHAAMSPAHVRKALEAIAPDVVCVESAPEWFAKGKFYRETYEADGVAVPWARERGLPVYGIDWVGNETNASDRERLARIEQESFDLRADTVDPQRFAYGAVSAVQLREVRPDPDCDFARLNSPAVAARNVEWLDSRRDVAGTPQQYIARRDTHIADEIAAAAAAGHRGKRLAVVIGAMHVGNLQRILPARGLAVAVTPDVAALAVDDAGLAAIDVAAMLAYATDNRRGVAPPSARLEGLRTRLRAEAANAPSKQLAALAAYLEARQAMLEGDHARAMRVFTTLAGAEAAVHFPYRGHEWRLHLTVAQAARLELGRIADLAGRRDDAVRHYERLLASLPEPAFGDDYHADFEFAAHARNAVRALLQTPFVAAMAFARVAPRGPGVAAASTDNPVVKRLQQAWELHRGKQWQELRDAVTAIDRKLVGDHEALELDYHLAVASVELGDRSDAATRVAALDTRAAALGADHWLVRHLPALRARLQ